MKIFGGKAIHSVYVCIAAWCQQAITMQADATQSIDLTNFFYTDPFFVAKSMAQAWRVSESDTICQFMLTKRIYINSMRFPALSLSLFFAL